MTVVSCKHVYYRHSYWLGLLVTNFALTPNTDLAAHSTQLRYWLILSIGNILLLFCLERICTEDLKILTISTFYVKFVNFKLFTEEWRLKLSKLHIERVSIYATKEAQSDAAVMVSNDNYRYIISNQSQGKGLLCFLLFSKNLPKKLKIKFCKLYKIFSTHFKKRITKEIGFVILKKHATLQSENFLSLWEDSLSF